MTISNKPDFSSNTDRKAEMLREIYDQTDKTLGYHDLSFLKKGLAIKGEALTGYLEKLPAKKRVIWNLATLKMITGVVLDTNNAGDFNESNKAYFKLLTSRITKDNNQEELFNALLSVYKNMTQFSDLDAWCNKMFTFDDTFELKELKKEKKIEDCLVTLLMDDKQTELIESIKYKETEEGKKIFFSSIPFYERKLKDDYRVKSLEVIKNGISGFTASSLSEELDINLSTSYSIIRHLKGTGAIKESGKEGSSKRYVLSNVDNLESKILFGKKGLELIDELPGFEKETLCNYRKNAYSLIEKVENSEVKFGGTVKTKDLFSDYNAIKLLVQMGVIEKKGKGEYSIKEFKLDESIKDKIKYFTGDEISRIKTHELSNLIIKYATKSAYNTASAEDIAKTLIEKTGLNFEKSKLESALELIKENRSKKKMYFKETYDSFVKKVKENDIEDLFIYEVESHPNVSSEEFYKKMERSFSKERIDSAISKLQKEGRLDISDSGEIDSPKKTPYILNKKLIKDKSALIIKSLLSATKQAALFSSEISNEEKEELEKTAESFRTSKRMVSKFSESYFSEKYPAAMETYKDIRQIAHDSNELYTMMTL